MPNVCLRIAMSLDGFVAGPRQSLTEPLGVGGERLHDWFVPLRAFRAAHGQGDDGVDDESSRLVAEWQARTGATVMGRNMFGGHPGPWDAAAPWRGWWGEDPPFHHPVFVLTHHPRAPLVMQGDTTFHFVTDGIESALRQAREAAGAKDVLIAGGASACAQYLRAGLVDEMLIHLVPIVLGAGERLLDGVDDLHGLRLARTVAMPGVTHLLFARG